MLPPGPITLTAQEAPSQLNNQPTSSHNLTALAVNNLQEVLNIRDGFTVPVATVHYDDGFFIAKIDIKDFGKEEVRFYRSLPGYLTIICLIPGSNFSYERSFEIPGYYNIELTRFIWESDKLLTILIPRQKMLSAMLPLDTAIELPEAFTNSAPVELNIHPVMPSATLNTMAPSCAGCHRCRGAFAVPTTIVNYFDLFLIAKINIRDFEQHEVRVFRAGVNLITIVCGTQNYPNRRNFERTIEIPLVYNVDQARSMWECVNILSIIVPRYQ